jgi:hypothetical protein
MTVLSIEGGAYCLRIPTSYFPKYRPDLEKGGESVGMTNVPDYKYKFSVDLNS